MIKLYNIECSAKSIKKAIVGTYKTMRFWQNQDGSLNIDYGSHYDLFLLKPTCKKSEYEITQWLFNK